MTRALDRALGDFNEMPTVAGSPIVESGSNTDGEWTRWADGTQICRREVTSIYRSNSDFIDSLSESWPVQFLSIGTTFAACSSGSPPITGPGTGYTRVDFDSSTLRVYVYRNGAAGAGFSPGDSMDISVISIGYWK